MKSRIDHLQVNIDFKNIAFYKKLFLFLGWEVTFENQNMLGLGSGTNGALWFNPRKNHQVNNYDSQVVNHLGIGVDSPSSINKAAQYLKRQGIVLLFGTPKYRPEFSSKTKTYYQIMFESPDKILWEVMYYGPAKIRRHKA